MRVTVLFVVASVIAPSSGGGRCADLVEPPPHLGRDLAVAHRGEQLLELELVLAVDRAELVDREVGVVPDARVEEPHRGVAVGEVRPLLGVAGHRRQLIRVAEQHELHAAERLVRLLPRLPQGAVHRIQQVGVDHRHLVDDEGVDGVEQLAQLGALVDLVVGDDADRQAEQRMDGLAADVERGDTGRCADHELLRRCSTRGTRAASTCRCRRGRSRRCGRASSRSPRRPPPARATVRAVTPRHSTYNSSMRRVLPWIVAFVLAIARRGRNGRRASTPRSSAPATSCGCTSTPSRAATPRARWRSRASTPAGADDLAARRRRAHRADRHPPGLGRRSRRRTAPHHRRLDLARRLGHHRLRGRARRHAARAVPRVGLRREPGRPCSRSTCSTTRGSRRTAWTRTTGRDDAGARRVRRVRPRLVRVRARHPFLEADDVTVLADEVGATLDATVDVQAGAGVRHHPRRRGQGAPRRVHRRSRCCSRPDARSGRPSPTA